MPKPVCSKSTSILPMGHFVFTPQNCKVDQSAHRLASLALRPQACWLSFALWVSITTTTKRVEGQLGGARKWNASWTDERVSQMLDAKHKKFIKLQLKIFIHKENTTFFLNKTLFKKKNLTLLLHSAPPQYLCVSTWTGTPYAWTGKAIGSGF